MISDLLINQQKFVLIVDNIGLEQHSDKIIKSWLQEHNIKNIQNIDLMKLSSSNLEENRLYLILNPLSDLFLDLKPSMIFEKINYLKKRSNIVQIFLWATSEIISESFMIPFLEYMADIILTFKNDEQLSILTKKSGGSVTNKLFSYKMSDGKFTVKSFNLIKKSIPEQQMKPQNLSDTFKIELSEDDLIARSNVKLPYERNINEEQESKVIYTPELDDDFDEEDPDDDLCI